MTRKEEEFLRLGDLLGDDIDAAAAPKEATSATPRPTQGHAPRERRAPGGAGPGVVADLARDLALAWPDVVGEEVAANSQPVRYSQGRLTVAASSTVWAQSLTFMEETIARGLNDRLGSQTVQRIVFRHAGWERHTGTGAPPPAAGHPEPPFNDTGLEQSAHSMRKAADASAHVPGVPAGPDHLTPEQEAALRGVEEMGLAPELQAKILCAMRATFVRDQRASVR